MNVDGTVLLCKDQLNSRHRNGTNTLTDCFSSHVGSGSLVHCLSGNFFTNYTTSADETGVSSRSSRPTGTAVNIGKSAPAVDARTPATLSSKKRCSLVASMSDDRGARPRPSSSSNDRQSRRGRDCSASRGFVQKTEQYYYYYYKCHGLECCQSHSYGSTLQKSRFKTVAQLNADVC